MNYSDVLLKNIRELNREVEHYATATTPARIAMRDALLQVLAWYVHKLQMRILPTYAPRRMPMAESDPAPVRNSGRRAMRHTAG